MAKCKALTGSAVKWLKFQGCLCVNMKAKQYIYFFIFMYLKVHSRVK